MQRNEGKMDLIVNININVSIMLGDYEHIFECENSIEEYENRFKCILCR